MQLTFTFFLEQEVQTSGPETQEDSCNSSGTVQAWTSDKDP
jgi:hypothetical protein